MLGWISGSDLAILHALPTAGDVKPPRAEGLSPERGHFWAASYRLIERSIRPASFKNSRAMDTTLMTQIAARVVAWHNRHPLARRITLAQVRSIGVVSLPFARRSDAAEAPPPGQDAAPAGRLAALRARLPRLPAALKWLRRRPAPAQTPADGLRAVFDEDFIGSLPDGEARRWADQHARLHRPGEDDWPQRDVPVDARWADLVPSPATASVTADLADLIVDLSDRIDAATSDEARAEPRRGPGADPHPDSPAELPPSELRYALTAAVEVDGARHRLLLDSAPKSAVLGRRAFSPMRIALLSVLLTGLCATALLLPRLARHPGGSAGATAHAAAASAAGSAAGAANGPATGAASGAHGAGQAVAAAASAAASGAAPAIATAASDAQAPATQAAAPTGHTPDGHAASAPALAAPLTDQVAGAAPASAAQGGRPTAHAGTKPPLQAPADAALPPTPGPVFALVSRSSASRAEPLVALERMQQAAVPLADKLPGTRTELVENGGRWSAIWWPFRSREDATQARWALALKGVTVEVVEF